MTELYIITTPVGDRAEADSFSAARVAAVTLLADSAEDNEAWVDQYLLIETGSKLTARFSFLADGTARMNQGQLRGAR